MNFTTLNSILALSTAEALPLQQSPTAFTNRTLSRIYSSPIVVTFIAFLLSVLCLWILVGNGMVLLVLLLDAKLRTTANVLIGNLAISDFLLALTVLVPFSISQALLGDWIWGKVCCIAWLSLDVLYCTASVWALVAIAFDRFTATVFPLWYRAHGDKRRAIVYSVLVWFLSALIVAPGLW